MRTGEELLALYEAGEQVVLHGREIELMTATLKKRIRANMTDFNPTIMSRKLEPFASVVDGTIITTQYQRKEHMKMHGLVDYEPTMVKRRRKEDE